MSALIIVLIATMGVAYGVFILATQALATRNAGRITCRGEHTTYTVTIQNGKLSINDIHARLCDSLTIINADNQLRLIAFGVHNHHQPYDGTTEQTLLKDQHMTVTLSHRGSYTFHDHLHDAVQGNFTVE